MLKKKKVAWISNRTPWCIHRARYINIYYIFIYLIYNYADAADHEDEDEAANDADAKNLPCL